MKITLYSTLNHMLSYTTTPLQRSPPIFDIPFAALTFCIFFYFYRKPNSNRHAAGKLIYYYNYLHTHCIKSYFKSAKIAKIKIPRACEWHAILFWIMHQGKHYFQTGEALIRLIWCISYVLPNFTIFSTLCTPGPNYLCTTISISLGKTIIWSLMCSEVPY